MMREKIIDSRTKEGKNKEFQFNSIPLNCEIMAMLTMCDNVREDYDDDDEQCELVLVCLSHLHH